MNDNRASLLGSSPLTRGKPGGGGVTPLPRRLIPAHAGKTFAATSYTTFSGAHPRSRGENGRWAVPVASALGSSPLTRGKPDTSALVGVRGRLIPAHAGKTGSRYGCPWVIWAHPRSRGENVGASSFGGQREGSSPLTRGKRSRSPAGQPHPRLIPAHAGKTPRSNGSPALMGAHPRSRGENSAQSTRVMSPRWLIPAHAGKTLMTTLPVSVWRAHPRSRGENHAR